MASLVFSMTPPTTKLTVSQLQDGDIFQLRGEGAKEMGQDVIFLCRAEAGEPEYLRITPHSKLTVVCYLEPQWPVQRYKANLQLTKED